MRNIWLRRAALALAFAVGAALPAGAGETVPSIVSAAAESSHVFCTGPCFLRSVYVTSGASAGYVLAYNLTAAPADGAGKTPQDCVALAANQTVALDYGSTADAFPVGLTVAFSTTGCFTQTLSATAFFKARKQP